MRRTDCPFPQIVVLPGHNRSRPCRDLIHTQLAFRGAHHKDSSLLDWSTEGKLTVPGPCVVLYVALTHGLEPESRDTGALNGFMEPFRDTRKKKKITTQHGCTQLSL